MRRSAPWLLSVRSNSPSRTTSSNHRRRPREQPLRCERGAVAQGCELRPDDVLGDPAHAGGGIETAVGSGNDPTRVADRPRDLLEARGDDFGMLDEIRQRINDPGNDDLIVGKAMPLEAADL